MSPDLASQLAGILRSMLPAGVAVAATEIRRHQPPLAVAEREASARMAPRRLREFTAGRACAHEALRQLGEPDLGIPVGLHREPVWPAGLVGSISHSQDVAAAAIAPLTVLAGIGIDIEPALPLDASLVGRVCRPSELARLGDAADLALRAKAIFCAKESVYKCLWPSTGLFLEFADVEIVPASSGTQFTVIGWGPLVNQPLAHLAGRIAVTAGHIITATWREPANQGPRRSIPERRSGPV